MKPIRILLADDEPLIIQGLKKWLSAERPELAIVGEAYDGTELQAKLTECTPDLLISDICMPGFSGIDIIKEINASKLPVKVILISAYQEFSYVKDALKYGALDYLVKPLDKSQFQQIVRKAIELIIHETEDERSKKTLVHYERKKRTETIEELLDRLTDAGGESAALTLADLGAVINRPFITVCLAEMDSFTESVRWHEQEHRLVHFAVSNVWNEAVSAIGGMAFRKGGHFAMLIQHDREEEAQDFAAEVQAQINDILKLNISIGSGRPVSTMKEAHMSCKEAAEALKWKYFLGTNHIILYQPAITDQNARFRFAELQELLVKEMIAPFPEELNSTVDGLLETVKTLACGSRSTAASMLYSAILRLQLEIKNLGIALDSVETEERRLLEAFAAYGTYGELGAGVLRIIEQMRRQIETKALNKELDLLVHVKKYIDGHYAENVTLEKAAGLVHMNPYYFSSFFKKHTGENFKQYLTEVRMKNAVRLLMQTDMMIYEIASQVGYGNARHFSDIFKRRFGIMPNEYKKSSRE